LKLGYFFRTDFFNVEDKASIAGQTAGPNWLIFFEGTHNGYPWGRNKG